MTVRAQARTDLALAVERATMVAVATMERWRRAVRGLPLLVSSDELRVALHGLSAWYERLCVDHEYAMPGPAAGVEALSRCLHLAEPASEEVLVAWWAVRVAEEIVGCRRLLAGADDTESIVLQLALSRLELAMYGVHEHLSPESIVSANEITGRTPSALVPMHSRNSAA